MKELTAFGWLLVVALIIEAVIAWPVMLAWNCVVPHMTKLPEIGFWQAFSMLFLLNMLRMSLFNKS